MAIDIEGTDLDKFKNVQVDLLIAFIKNYDEEWRAAGPAGMLLGLDAALKSYRKIDKMGYRFIDSEALRDLVKNIAMHAILALIYLNEADLKDAEGLNEIFSDELWEEIAEDIMSEDDDEDFIEFADE